ncbi:GNAT family N-acetyltransferase [Microbacterium sp. ZW T5_56]|uniref:GNAT family N-acetyltransferase n=1 Tax=Microbacterium sp. ZW T5_56 TaxID=3378081 RepID=UPI0038528BCE
MTQLFMTHPGPLSALQLPPLAEGLELRAAGPDDESAIADVLAESFEEEWDVARVQAQLTEASDVAVTWVVVRDGAILGVASERLMPETYADAGYVHYVGVARSARGLRLGAVLTARCVLGFHERGLATAVLETDDFRVPAVITYLRLGFIPTYRSSDEQVAWSALLPTLFATKP